MAGETGGVIGLELRLDGAQLFPRAAVRYLGLAGALFDTIPLAAGSRLAALGDLAPALVRKGVVGSIAAGFLGENAKPVRLIAFDKNDEANWSLGWHQDRTVCVKDRHEVSGFGPWTIKQGLHHVQPPFQIIADMITVRIHVDPVEEDNAPLLVALGSHNRGLIPEGAVQETVIRSQTHTCLAADGDVWVYSTPILHGSEKATPGRRRRVLQVDYSADELPTPLEWLLS